MNKERINQLADLLENYHKLQDRSIGFYMGNYFVESEEELPTTDFQNMKCDSVGCIAGWAVFHFGEKERLYRKSDTEPRQMDIVDEAKNLLGLSGSDAIQLFEPEELFCHAHIGDKVTAQEAAQTLRHLAETGEIDWTHVTSKYDEEGED